MGNDPAMVIFAVLFPVLLVGEIVLVVLLWHTGGGRLPRLGSPREGTAGDGSGAPGGKVGEVWLVTIWALSTGLAMGMGFVATFVAVHVILFTLGTQAAMVGLVISAIFLGAIPVVVALVVYRRSRSR